jgi:uncharacterized protein
MRIELSKHPSAPTIIVGFPGVGLIGPIVTEFLIDHMKTEVMGSFVYDELPPLVPIHKGTLVHPMSVHYSEQYNTVIVYTILNLKKHEWKVAAAIAQLARDLQAKEIICLDGATTVGADESIYVYGNPQFVTLGAKAMEESVILGVNGALLLSAPNTSCIFAPAQLEMPDSKAAAEVVKFLDKYLGLNVDYHPLLEQAQKFEEKLKSVMSTQRLTEEEKKSLDYFG